MEHQQQYRRPGFIYEFVGVECCPPDANEVLNIQLSHMMLWGQFPCDIGNCTRLAGLDLSANELSGPLPFDIGDLIPFVSKLDIFGNKFFGEIPKSFVNCSVMAFFLSNYMAFMIKKNRIEKMAQSKRRRTNKEADQVNYLPTKGFLQEGRKKLEGMVPRMNFTEFSQATSNFSTNNAIGLGKIAMMYKTVLPDGSPFVVKRLYGCQLFEKQFISKLLALGTLKHNNLVPILGFYRERKEKLLVYKYISNSNLYDWLHARESMDKILEWPLRNKIAIGIARGLACLHHKCNF
ncbi:probable inactive receptor kinase At1g27190 [Quercus robur]|uniref:probable inactive receptor kinase At1g27190 n=1 Tax=Quercus robur TaxID=38942 RepID=UPI0021629EDA|nr:probable inactive receptor kinase At1g27190 [Quercus robur]